MDAKPTATPIRPIASASASASTTPSSNTAAAMVVPDEDHGTDMPMSMTASMMLGNLPRTSAQALQEVEAIDERKGTWVSIQAKRSYPLGPRFASPLFQPRAYYVSICAYAYHTASSSPLLARPPNSHRLTHIQPIVTIRFYPVGSAPPLRQKVFKVSASQKFETVVNFLRKKLECKSTDSVFCYVNSVFAPGLDEGVGGLFRVSSISSLLSGSLSGRRRCQ